MNNSEEKLWTDRYLVLEKPLFNVVYRWTWDREEARDIVQEAFLRCWRKRADIHDSGFKALVYRVALNLASNQRRRTKLWRLAGVEALENLAADHEPSFVSAPLRNAVDGLPERYKRVLLLGEIAGMNYREIAAVTGVREGTVGSRRHRALALLRRRLESMGVAWDED